MPLITATSPYISPSGSVTRVMLQVLLALVPGIFAVIWFFGWGVIVNMTIAITTALVFEAIMLKLRHRPVTRYLTDGSAIVTAVLLALAIPSLAPWWIVFIGTAFAIVFGKQLFGGLGYNPFNPAMLGYALLLISFPREMTVWVLPHGLHQETLGFLDTVTIILGEQVPAHLNMDALTSATPLDTVKTQIGLKQTLDEIYSASLFGVLAGKGWEWINAWFLVGGMWLLYKRIISWHIPFALLGGMFAIALVFYLVDSDAYPSPVFHWFSGAAMLGAFFIATDPISACTTNKGRLIFGAGIGILTYIIRSWGGYPDGIAFAVLLMNMAAPTIDHYTQPRVFGHSKDEHT